MAPECLKDFFFKGNQIFLGFTANEGNDTGINGDNNPKSDEKIIRISVMFTKFNFHGLGDSEIK
jgi:hypothetical protein